MPNLNLLVRVVFSNYCTSTFLLNFQDVLEILHCLVDYDLVHIADDVVIARVLLKVVFNSSIDLNAN